MSDPAATARVTTRRAAEVGKPLIIPLTGAVLTIVATDPSVSPMLWPPRAVVNFCQRAARVAQKGVDAGLSPEAFAALLEALAETARCEAATQAARSRVADILGGERRAMEQVAAHPEPPPATSA